MSSSRCRKRMPKQDIGMPDFYSWVPAVTDGTDDYYDGRTGLRVLEVRSVQSLIQLTGYVKYKLSASGFHVLYRGQTDLYATGNDSAVRYRFQPSALREITKSNSYKAKILSIERIIEELRATNRQFEDKDKFPNAVLEGLLQQYGIPTTWIDAVDNIWTALWFACYRTIWDACTRNDNGTRNYYHMILRGIGECDSGEDYAYLFILAANGIHSEWLDLREKIPSNFIRPHAQHGCLIRMVVNGYNPNMVDLIQGIVRVRLRDALQWLGSGRMLLPDSMVPPPNYDSGFRQLLQSEHLKGSIRYPIYC